MTSVEFKQLLRDLESDVNAGRCSLRFALVKAAIVGMEMGGSDQEIPETTKTKSFEIVA